MIDIDLIEREVFGWLGTGEVEKLHELASICPNNKSIELGSYLGKSAITIGLAMKEKSGTLICVDAFYENQHFVHKDKDETVRDSYKYFWDNINKFGLSETVITIRGQVRDLLPKIGGRFGLIFVDASHTMDHVVQDGMWAYRNVVPGGYVVFHDYGNENWGWDVKPTIEAFKNLWKGEWSHHWMLAIFKKG